MLFTSCISFRKNGLLFLLLVYLQYLSPTTSSRSYSGSGGREKFERVFMKTCSKYPFVQQYINLVERPSDEFTIFVFHEPGQGNNGGLGDRFGGLVTAIAYSLRANRTFLVSGDKAFEESFTSYHPSKLLHVKPTSASSSSSSSSSSSFSSFSSSLGGWGDWNWAGWKREYHGNMTFMRHCINPKPRDIACALDNTNIPTRVVKFRGNRAYICRWAVKPNLRHLNILSALGVDRDKDDLFEVAGCLMRLALWPTPSLWKSLDLLVQSEFDSLHGVGKIDYQLGMHFRCGDKSFSPGGGGGDKNKKKAVGYHPHADQALTEEASKPSPPNPSCYFDPKVQWNGTTFEDEIAYDSPVDHANCARGVLANLTMASKGGVVTYVASDNRDSAKQMNGTLQWGHSIVPSGACHVDMQSYVAGGINNCVLLTSAQWLMLSLSDVIIMQSIVKLPLSMQMGYYDVTAPPPDKIQEAPISAFSRYAAIYALAPNVMRFGKSCKTIDKTILSRQSQGNWMCDPKVFY